MTEPLPYLTSDIAPIAFTIRAVPQDFRVEEIPAYTPSGEGDHVYITIEKQGLSTMEAVRRIGKSVGLTPSQFGYAGLKDARAVTVQTLSVEHFDPERLQGLDLENIRILSVARHRNKLKTGHLHGNRFVLKLRGLDPARLKDFSEILNRLVTKGTPNYFGSQRFGMRGDTWQTGQALLKQDYELAARLMAGTPGPKDQGRILEAREAFMKGEYSRSAGLWPGAMFYCAVLCRLLAAHPQNFRRAVRSIDKKILKFHVSAFQSKLFNDMLASRISSLEQVFKGDWAVKHASGGMFLVESEETENPRAGNFEISAALPLFGKKIRPTSGEPEKREEEILKLYGVNRADFEQEGLLNCEGDRRPVRFKPEELSWEQGRDDAGDYVELKVTLPAGCYATVFLREIAKGEMHEILSSAAAENFAADQG